MAGIHAAAPFIAGGPEGAVEVGFLDSHEFSSRGIAAENFRVPGGVAGLKATQHGATATAKQVVKGMKERGAGDPATLRKTWDTDKLFLN